LKHSIYILILLFFSKAQASLEQTYGLGGTTSGRVSGITADSSTPYAAIFNPALLGAKKETQFAFSLGFQNSSFDKGGNVLVDSPAYRTIDGVQRTAEFDLPRLSETLWSLGACFPFNSKALHRNMGLGVALSGPTGKLRTFSAQTPYDFSVLRPGTSDSQFKGSVALGSEIIPETLYFGAGLSLFITAAGAADAFLLDNNPTGRLNLEVGFNTATTIGLFAKLPTETKEPHQFSFVFHQAIHPSFEEHFTGKVQVAEGAGTAAIPAILRTSLYYEPHSFELEWQKQFSDFTFSAGLSYQLWKNYEPSYLTLESPTSRSRV
jgi:hypothetical protein